MGQSIVVLGASMTIHHSPSPTRLAVVTSHPIQYNAPLFGALAQRRDLAIKVFYCWEGWGERADVGFGRQIAWDIPLLDGYDHEFVPNVSAGPGTHGFLGLDNPQMVSRIEEWGAQAVLVYGWSSKTNLAVMRHFKGRCPVLFRGDSTLASRTGLIKGLLRTPALKWVYRHIDVALFAGENNRAYFLEHGVGERQLAWVPHAVDNTRFEARGIELDALAEIERTDLGIATSDVVFLYAGKFVAHKGLEFLLKCFAAYCAHGDCARAHLVLAGSGPLEARLRGIANEASNIHFIGFRNQAAMPLTYRIGDVFVLPSTRDTWGLCVNEAMACARPIIVSTQVGCAPDLARSRDYATVFESGSAQSFERALKTFTRQREELHDLGMLAAAEIQRWSIPQAAERVARAVANIVTVQI